MGVGDGCSFRGKQIGEVMVSGAVVAPIAYVSGEKICGVGRELHLYGIIGPTSDAGYLLWVWERA